MTTGCMFGEHDADGTFSRKECDLPPTGLKLLRLTPTTRPTKLLPGTAGVRVRVQSTDTDNLTSRCRCGRRRRELENAHVCLSFPRCIPKTFHP
jgi:hypothetical protein